MRRKLTVSCPACFAEVPWSAASQWRPFCSSRCRTIDLGDWASKRFVIDGDELTDRSGEASPPSIGESQ
jgi:uncharacterized protein